ARGAGRAPRRPPGHPPDLPPPGVSPMRDTDDIADRLAEPFDPDELSWKPGAVSGNRCLALAYVTARAVMDRLDAVVGVAGWQDSYKVLPDGCVMCKLHVCLGDRWVTKMDVGSPSEQPDHRHQTN